MVKCRCGCGVIFNEKQGYYNIPQVGPIKCECYDKIVPIEHRGSFIAVKIIQEYVKTF